MRANILLGWALLGLAAVMIVGAISFVWVMSEPPAHAGPLDSVSPCRPIVGGPTRVYVCATGHAYALQGRELVDLGPVTGATPKLPRR